MSENYVRPGHEPNKRVGDLDELSCQYVFRA